MKNKISFVGLILSIVLFVSLYQSKEFTDPNNVPKHYFLAFSSLISLIAPFVYFLRQKGIIWRKITLIDLSVWGYFTYLSVNLVLVEGNPFMEIKWLSIFILIVVYTIFKPFFQEEHKWNNNNKLLYTLLFVLLFIGVIQAIWGLGQYYGVFENIQNEFKITTAFGNPGPYANYLVSLLPFSLIFSVFQTKKKLRYLAIVSGLLIIVTLPFTAARTSWIAALAVIIFIFLHTKLVANLWKKFFSSVIAKLILFLIVFAFIISAIYALSSFKQDSASGRVFVWKVTLDMIKDKPILGHGYASYPVVHNNYQADYFRANPEDWENAFLADGVNYAFNEFLQLTAEVGIVGLLLFLFIIYAVYKRKRLQRADLHNPFTIGAEGAILAILVSSLFSYPLHDIPTLTIFFVSLAILSANTSNTLYNLQITSKQCKLFVLAAIVLGLSFYKMEHNRFIAEKRWVEAFHLVRQRKYSDAQKAYPFLYPTLKYNEYFLFNYGAEYTVMEQYKKSVQILEEVEDRINDSDFYIYLGTSKEGIGDYQGAMKCFEQASMIMPIKFFPRYRLVLLHQKMGNIEAAKNMAQQIIDLPVKVESDIVTAIKNEMKLFLEHNEI